MNHYYVLLCFLSAAPAFGGMRETFGEKAVLRTAGSAGFGHALRRPVEWARTAAGYGRRAGSGFAQYGVKTGIHFAVGALRQEEQRYQRAEVTGVWRRTRHALMATLIVPRKKRDGKTVAAGRLSGAFGGGFISRLWQPVRLRTFSSGFASGGISLGIDAGMNVLREFWPDLRGRKEPVGRPSGRLAGGSGAEAATSGLRPAVQPEGCTHSDVNSPPRSP